MKVDRVSASVRFSQDTGKGSWKVIEVGAEGTVDDQEGWQRAQSELYTKLSTQLKEQWASGCKGAITEHSPSLASQQHWCQEHGTAFNKKTGQNGSEWYSHKAPDGSWCRE